MRSSNFKFSLIISERVNSLFLQTLTNFLKFSKNLLSSVGLVYEGAPNFTTSYNVSGDLNNDETDNLKAQNLTELLQLSKPLKNNV